MTECNFRHLLRRPNPTVTAITISCYCYAAYTCSCRMSQPLPYPIANLAFTVMLTGIVHNYCISCQLSTAVLSYQNVQYLPASTMKPLIVTNPISLIFVSLSTYRVSFSFSSMSWSSSYTFNLYTSMLFSRFFSPILATFGASLLSMLRSAADTFIPAPSASSLPRFSSQSL